MIVLLVPGVGMGGNASDAVQGGVARLLMMGVGRLWWVPFLLLTSS